MPTLIRNAADFITAIQDKNWLELNHFISTTFSNDFHFELSTMEIMIQISESISEMSYIDVASSNVALAYVFADLEKYASEHANNHIDEFLSTFINNIIDNIIAEKEASPDYYTMTEVEAKLAFYIARNLIRKNDPIYLESIRFLVNISEVTTLLTVAVTPNIENELIRLANSINNELVFRMLMGFVAVSSHMISNNFYIGPEVDVREGNRVASQSALSIFSANNTSLPSDEDEDDRFEHSA